MGKDISAEHGYKYLLNKNTGVAHDLTNSEENCQIDEIKDDHKYYSNYLYSDIKEHDDYKEECDYCLNPDG